MSKRIKSDYVCNLCDNNNYEVISFKRDYNGERIMECISEYADFHICKKCLDRINEVLSQWYGIMI